MPEPIGSVYLDQPRPRRAPPIPERRARAAVAVPMAFVGIVGLTVAGLLVGVRSAIATPDPIVAAVQSTFQDPESRAEITRELATAIQASLLTPEVLAAAELYGVDSPELDLTHTTKHNLTLTAVPAATANGPPVFHPASGQ